MIGSDYCYSFIFGEVLKEEVNEPVAINSLFGWILSGRFDNPTSVNLNSVHVLRIHTKTMSENIFDDKLDSCSKHVFPRHQESEKVENNKAYIDFKDSLSFENGRYSTKLLFKEFYHVLSDNYRLAVKKSNYLKRRLNKDKAHLDEYNKIFNDYLNNDIIEKVDIKKDNPGARKVHYLPHRPVIKSDRETTKICIAFDASAHVNGELCLNDILDSGPCLIPLIFDILLRFRTGKIGLVTDMKQAFLQINIAEEHRDFLHFIWHQEFNLDENIILCFKRTVFGLTCSPFLLNATVKLHLEKFLSIDSFKIFIEKLLLNLYVDDLNNSFDNIKDAIEFYKVSKKCLADGNFI